MMGRFARLFVTAEGLPRLGENIGGLIAGRLQTGGELLPGFVTRPGAHHKKR